MEKGKDIKSSFYLKYIADFFQPCFSSPLIRDNILCCNKGVPGFTRQKIITKLQNKDKYRECSRKKKRSRQEDKNPKAETLKPKLLPKQKPVITHQLPTKNYLDWKKPSPPGYFPSPLRSLKQKSSDKTRCMKIYKYSCTKQNLQNPICHISICL